MSRFKLTFGLISLCIVGILTQSKLTNHVEESRGEFSFAETSVGEARNDRYRRNTPADPDKEKSDENEIIDQTLALLEEGNRNIQTSNDSDVVLMVGNTGSGKTTITLFLTSDNSKLEAYQADSVTTRIRDHFNRISTSTIVSKTIFPELMIDEETNTPFYDCPGFSDTRNSTVEIVNSVFMKTAADKATRVKIVLIVNHFSLKSGSDRTDFIALVKSISAFLRNFDTFRPAVSLIATKVESIYSDSRIIEGIAEFLTKEKKVLDQVLAGDQLLAAQKLFETLVEQNNDGEYTRISFFRQPNGDELGPLSENKKAQEIRLHMRNVIWNNTKFVNKSEDDFGFPLSEKALNDVRTLTDIICDRIYNYFESLSKELTEAYTKQFTQSKEHLDLASFKVKLEDLFGIFKYVDEMELDLKLTQNKDISPKDYLNDVVAKLAKRETTTTSACEEIFKGITNNAKYLGFLTSLTANSVTKSMPMQPRSLSVEFERWLEPLKAFKHSAKSELDAFDKHIDNRILSLINRASSNLKNYYENAFSQMNNLTITEFDAELKNLLLSLSKIDHFCQENPHNQTNYYSDFGRQLVALINNLDRQEPRILEPNLEAELKTGAEYVNFVTTYHETSQNTNALQLQSQNTRETKKFRWTSELRLAVTQIKSKYVDLERMIHARIISAVTNLANKDLTQHYASQFQSTENIEDFKGRLNTELFSMKTTVGGFELIPPNLPRNETHSKLVYNTIESFLTPVSQSNAFRQSLQLQQLEKEGSFLDTLQKYSTFSIEPDPLKWFSPLKQFFQSLNSTVNEPVSCGYNPAYEFDPDLKLGENLIVAKGTFVSLTEALNCFYNRCKRHVKNLVVLAKHTVYIDAELDPSLNPMLIDLNINVLSPNWVALRRTSLSLNGLPGESYSPNKAGRSATTGYGESGKPGLPGRNAGNFLLVGRNFGGETVTICADGGRGGDGQEGGDGDKGAEGENVDLGKIQFTVDSERKNTDYDTYKVQIRITSHGNYEYSGGSHGCKSDDRNTSPLASEESVYACQEFSFTGVKAEGGKPGGHGGKGGMGGNNGLIKLFGPDPFKSSFITSSNSGSQGSGSRGGKGGLGGKHGNRLAVTINPTLRHLNGGKFTVGSPSFPWGDGASNGADGVLNSNEVNRQSPPPPDYDSVLLIQSNSVKVFRNYARSHLENAFYKKVLLDFLDDIKALR